ncbi:hypothetical protein EVAR_96919_1 [Eumeta japonica]|uniref:Uncharacterized protein n=1 Tax=Eumeta variegata TaxID=151549 RepID=A0A4C1WC12_EUMVA|nr:hypothetical protein EVAR_96919_1 [Eumeta japonica]
MRTKLSRSRNITNQSPGLYDGLDSHRPSSSAPRLRPGGIKTCFPKHGGNAAACKSYNVNEFFFDIEATLTVLPDFTTIAIHQSRNNCVIESPERMSLLIAERCRRPSKPQQWRPFGARVLPRSAVLTRLDGATVALQARDVRARHPQTRRHRRRSLRALLTLPAPLPFNCATTACEHCDILDS